MLITTPFHVLTDVLQVSLLALLFILYINDLTNSIYICKFIMIANDTTISFTYTSLDALFKIANAELIKIAVCFYENN